MENACKLPRMESDAPDSRHNVETVLSASAQSVLTEIRASGFTGWSVLGLEQSRSTVMQLEPLAGSPEEDVSEQSLKIARTDGSILEATLFSPKHSGPLPV